MMVEHPSEYSWSSYCYNALDKEIQLIRPHSIYTALGKTKKERRKAYQKLVEQLIPDYTLQEIRDAINKTWVLGDERFKQQIEEQSGRRASPHKSSG